VFPTTIRAGGDVARENVFDQLLPQYLHKRTTGFGYIGRVFPCKSTSDQRFVSIPKFNRKWNNQPAISHSRAGYSGRYGEGHGLRGLCGRRQCLPQFQPISGRLDHVALRGLTRSTPKAWDSSSAKATRTYSINVTGFAAPTPPVSADRILNIDKRYLDRRQRSLGRWQLQPRKHRAIPQQWGSEYCQFTFS